MIISHVWPFLITQVLLSHHCSGVNRVSYRLQIHDDVIKWKHFPRYWPFVRGRIHRSPVNTPHKGQWRGALIFSLICVWINSWVNNRDAGDLRRYRTHYDVSVMNRHGWWWAVTVPQQVRTPQYVFSMLQFNTLRPRQNGGIFKCIFLNQYIWISIKIPLKFVPKGPTNTIPALVQIMAWR